MTLPFLRKQKQIFLSELNFIHVSDYKIIVYYIIQVQVFISLMLFIIIFTKTFRLDLKGEKDYE